MNQNETFNLATQKNAQIYTGLQMEAKNETARNHRREWLPEDHDDWYEPDYACYERGI